MPLDRRALLGTMLLTTVGTPAHSARPPILRVNGEVTAETYKGLEAFLFNSLDTIVGLKVSFPQTGSTANDALSASAEGDKFVAYVGGPNSESEMVANAGFSFQHGSYVFDGFFVVKSGGMQQGIVSLFLDKTEEAAVLLSGVKVKDIRIDRLDPTIQKQD